ncbi:hypothetical protein CC86DRAFT_202617 [Ophiobolus disseminans]|uniref:Uncharacterized protein n=1 Tax=Ophiobolus disseminans TaxID=1469910 RepID=A0A6A7A576_9PLEO|nr:hypothetical protein CC86DRAFT_202617 [Ophiobolus disseminans]
MMSARYSCISPCHIVSLHFHLHLYFFSYMSIFPAITSILLFLHFPFPLNSGETSAMRKSPSLRIALTSPLKEPWLGSVQSSRV